MADDSGIFSALLIFVTSVLLVVTGIKKRPGIGIIGALVILAMTIWSKNGNRFDTIGLVPPSSWYSSAWCGFLYSLAIFFIAYVFIEPLSEISTKTKHDYSKFDSLRGKWLPTIQILLFVWIFVAVIEEVIYRGFLMNKFSKVAGTGPFALTLSLLFTSIVFGLSHGYQNRSGMLSTGAIGLLFGCVFVFSGFNLWAAIFAHGFIDTIGIILIAVEGDIFIRQKILVKIWNLPQ